MDYLDTLDAIRRIERVHPPLRVVRPLLRDRSNPIETLNDVEFIARYRLSKDACMELLSMIKEDLSFVSSRHHTVAVPPILRLLVALRFFAAGHFQMTDGDLLMMSKSTVCVIVHQVARAIARRIDSFVRFPTTPHELQAEKNAFYSMRQFPRVIGLIDGTHIPIQSPGGDDAEVFRNRKGKFTVNCQMICKSDMQFIHISARWKGSTHDSRMLNYSTVPSIMQNTDGLLLGDSGYPCLPYLMTPILNPANPAEARYNKAHVKTRNLVERSFGVWKQRFRCLSIPMRTRLDHTLTIIVATACLHNFAITHRLVDLDDWNENEEDQEVDHLGGEDDLSGTAIRSELVSNHFTRH